MQFEDTPITETLSFLISEIERIREKEGISDEFLPTLILTDAEKFSDVKITLRLSNVPVVEALRYTTSLARCKYRIEGSRIFVEPMVK